MSALLLLLSAAWAWTPSTGATWPTALEWQLQSGGSASLPNLSQVEGIFLTSYATWEAPSCTNFQHAYGGTSTRLSSNNGDGVTVHGFLASWPRSYGDRYSVIGITSAIYSGTEMLEADVSFNEDIYRFTVGAPSPFAYEADLESIATHEFGHSLGMGHTNVSGATMFPTYDNGTASRSLANDDITGVCTLYPSGSTLPTDDAFEPNDEPDDATEVGCGVRVQGTGADQDWFTFTTDQQGEITAALQWNDASVDLDLYLFDTANELARSEAANGAEELVGVTQPAGTYYLLINPYAGTTEYTLDIECNGSAGGAAADDAYEDNDQADSATAVACPFSTQAYAGDQDWFAFQTTSTGGIRATLTWLDGGADLDLYLADTTEVLSASEASDGREESVAADDAPAGTYAVIVNPYQGASEYRLDVECDGVELLGDTASFDTDDLGGPALFADCGCAHTDPRGALPLLPVLWVGRRRRTK